MAPNVSRRFKRTFFVRKMTLKVREKRNCQKKRWSRKNLTREWKNFSKDGRWIRKKSLERLRKSWKRLLTKIFIVPSWSRWLTRRKITWWSEWLSSLFFLAIGLTLPTSRALGLTSSKYISLYLVPRHWFRRLSLLRCSSCTNSTVFIG